MPMNVFRRDPFGTHLPSPVADAPLREEDVEEFKSAVLAKLTLSVGKHAASATDRDWFIATSLALRDRVVHRWLATDRLNEAKGRKRVYYLSLEFLIGRLINDIVGNLRCGEIVQAALGDLGVDPERVRCAEPDAALGNGGLGRLAACFMESMASLGIPACGYGIRYDHGLFQQVIKDGWQQEHPEQWLLFGNPWEFERPEVTYDIQFGGWVERDASSKVAPQSLWRSEEIIKAIAYDTPILGWRGRHVNVLRLWSARSVDPLNLDVFNEGDYLGALSPRARAEAISKILYPSDDTPSGRELRLRQEYFFVSASLQDLVCRHTRNFGSIYSLAERTAIQLNDTHPSLAVAELMRILVDLHKLPWDDAWRITVAAISYTNHTLLPEALESWPLPLFERLLPRHLEIIYAINARHLEVARRGGECEPELLREISLIDESNGRQVRMGHLAFIGSHRINGVSKLHTELLRNGVFGGLDRLYPDRIVDVTNGISFRRWLHQANPGLTSLLHEICGSGVLDDPAALRHLADHADDASLQQRFAAVKRVKKLTLARFIRDRLGLNIDPGALFDVQIKRIHEYKRQLLNILETIARYQAIRAHPNYDWVPRVKIFAGKAAPSYSRAKLIIKLAHDVAGMINSDRQVDDLLKVVFLPNYNVSLAEAIIPAADLSEQISTAGMEASGTGNMKLALNGALTIGTLDGANVEIRDHVGDANIFIFGLRAEEVVERWRQGLDAGAAITASPALSAAIAALETALFASGDPHRFAALANILRFCDPHMIAADFDAYYDAQKRVDELWQSPARWRKAALLNIAGMSWFSSDRAIAEYARTIWNIPA